MRMYIRLMVFVLLLSTMAWAAITQEPDELRVSQVWAQALNEDGTSLGIYLTIENHGSAEVILSGAQSNIAETITIAGNSDDDGLVIATRETITLTPETVYLRVDDLEDAFAPDNVFALTLTFDLPGDDTYETVTAARVVDETPEFDPDLTVVGAWARATISLEMAEEMPPDPDMMPVTPSAAFMTIFNRGDDDVQLVAAATDAAGLVEIHETAMDGEVMRMRPVEGLTIPADASTTLEPGGYHVMLMELQRELIPGDAILLTLIFDNGVEIPVAVPVRESDRTGAMDMEMD